MAGTIIEIKNLTKVFKNNSAVHNLNLKINSGELFGLVGPDGAGKTTTLRLLAGILAISSGSATVAGHDLGKESEAIKSKIGYMAQQFSLYSELSVIENLRFFADIYNVDPNRIEARMERLLNFAGLSEFKNRWAAHLSGGMQKKLALACTLIHQPPILLLDEPTTGVDPISRREFWKILTELHIEGTTIIVSTPYMDEADRCSTVGLMNNGKLIVCASPEKIKADLTGELIELIPNNWQKTLDQIKSIPGVLEIQTYGESLHIFVDSADIRMPQIKNYLHRNNLSYQSIRIATARMEEAFISLIRQVSEEHEPI